MHVLGKKRASDFSYVHPFFSNGEQKYLIPNHLQTYPEFTFERVEYNNVAEGRDAFVEISETIAYSKAKTIGSVIAKAQLHQAEGHEVTKFIAGELP